MGKENLTLVLKQLNVVHWRNYLQEELSISSKFNLFLGNNGMGKTSLLEAIYYLCLSKHPHSLPDKHLARHESTFFRLQGLFLRNQKQEQVVVKWQPGKKKVLERNGVPYSRMADHVGLLPVVYIAPDDTELVMGFSEVRRKFMDFTISQCDAAYLEELVRYTQALEQRNALLKAYDYPPTGLLDGYDALLAPAGEMLLKRRKSFIAELLPVFQKYYHALADGKEAVHIDYTPSFEEGDFLASLEMHRNKDQLLKRTSIGVHKDDLDFLMQGVSAKLFASQGQVKSYVLALRLAQYEWLSQHTGVLPILLLDDLFDKLDTERVSRLLELLSSAAFGQVFITDTHTGRLPELLKEAGITCSSWTIQNGNAMCGNNLPAGA